MVEDKGIDIQYNRSEENPAVIMAKNTCEESFVKHIKMTTEVELWQRVETVRDNVKNTRVTDDVIKCTKTEYSSPALAEVVDGENRNYCTLVTISRIGK